MSTNGETADLMVREGIQITESVVKLAGLGAKNLAALLIALANDNQKLAGKTTLKRLIQDGDELTIFSVKKEDLDGFRMEAKSYGVLYCPIVNKMENTGTVEIMAMLMCMSAPTFAAASAEEQQTEAITEAAVIPPSPTVYPAEVRASEENGVARLEKVYYLTVRDDPAAIPTEDFDREGRHYTLLDVLKTDLTETDTKDFTEVITLKSATKDVGEIIKALEPEREIVTEDGYSGVLKPDYTTINVEAAGYRTNSWTVSAKRTYPNLSDADVSLIPKSIEDGGRSLTLANVDWQAGNTDYVDGDALAVRYTALATYTGTATGRSVTGYTVTVDYTGEVSKSSSDTIIYTAVFSSTDKQTVEPVIPDKSDTHSESGNEAAEETVTPAPAPTTAQPSKARLLLIPVGVAALGAAGYFGRKGYKHYINKKRGYE